jgi:outer membrane protein assembly factor BamB
VLGSVDGKALVSSETGEVMALDVEDGRTLWAHELSETATNVLLDAQGALVYVSSAGGKIEAYKLSELEDRNLVLPIDPAWSTELDGPRTYDLISLPLGGLVAFSRSSMEVISDSGEPLWNQELVSGITDWAQTKDGLVLLARDEVWLADEQGVSQMVGPIGGQRVVASEQPYIYAEDGVYQIYMESGLMELLFGLSSGFTRSGGLSEIPGGGILVAHTDLDDKRLIAIDQEGLLLWERSIASLGARAVELLSLNGEIYLMAQYDIGRSTGIDLFHVGSESGDLTRIFSGGTRSTSPNPAEVAAIGELIVIRITGVGLAALDPQAALEAVVGE